MSRIVLFLEFATLTAVLALGLRMFVDVAALLALPGVIHP